MSAKCTKLSCIAYVSWHTELNCHRCESTVERTAGVVYFEYAKGKVSEHRQRGPAWALRKEVLQKALEVTAAVSGPARV